MSYMLTHKKAVEVFYGLLDQRMNAGWRAFVRDMQHNNDRHNNRLFKVLAATKGCEFVEDVISMINCFKNPHGLLHVVKQPDGMCFKDSRWTNIPELWVHQKFIGKKMEGSICIQVKDNRWIKLHI